jgi:hypothetical protein
VGIVSGIKQKALKNEEFATVQACLEAGHTWDECSTLKIDKDRNMRVMLKKSCPLPMREEIKKKAFAGEPVTFSDEK